jgi:hypothetical protein
MPTFMVFKDGNKVDDLVGANPPRLEVRTLIVHTMCMLLTSLTGTGDYGLEAGLSYVVVVWFSFCVLCIEAIMMTGSLHGRACPAVPFTDLRDVSYCP